LRKYEEHIVRKENVDSMIADCGQHKAVVTPSWKLQKPCKIIQLALEI